MYAHHERLYLFGDIVTKTLNVQRSNNKKVESFYRQTFFFFHFFEEKAKEKVANKVILEVFLFWKDEDWLYNMFVYYTAKLDF